MKRLTNIINENVVNIDDKDVILGLALVNPSLLDFVDHPQNQYLFKDHTFQNMLRQTNIQFSNKLDWQIPNTVNNIDISIEKDWRKLLNIKKRLLQLLNTYPDIKKLNLLIMDLL